MNEQTLTNLLLSQENLLAMIRRSIILESIFLITCSFALIFLVIKGMVIGIYYKINLLLLIAIVLSGFSVIKTRRLYQEHAKHLIEFYIRMKNERGSYQDEAKPN